MTTLSAYLLTAACCLTLAVFANRAAYRNGFWDGVIWERERLSGGCYPSKPDSCWPLWASIEEGARQRKEACSCARHRRCQTHGDLAP